MITVLPYWPLEAADVQKVRMAGSYKLSAVAVLVVGTVTSLLYLSPWADDLSAPGQSQHGHVHHTLFFAAGLALTALCAALLWLAGVAAAHRRAAGRVLRRSEETYRIAFEDAMVGMCIAKYSGAIVRANPAFAAMLGRDVDVLCRSRSWTSRSNDSRSGSWTTAPRCCARWSRPLDRSST